MNSIPNLVARALRDRQRITCSYIGSSIGFAATLNAPRAKILRSVRGADLTAYKFGVYLDASREKLTLGEYRIEPPPEPVKPIESINQRMHALTLARIQGYIETLTLYDKQLAQRLQDALNSK